jgi:hypothetical protein
MIGIIKFFSYRLCSKQNTCNNKVTIKFKIQINENLKNALQKHYHFFFDFSLKNSNFSKNFAGNKYWNTKIFIPG